MKKMYNQPITEVAAFKTEHLMEAPVVSPGAPTDPSNPPIPHAPKHGDIIE